MATKRLKDDDGNVYEVDIDDEDEDEDGDEDEEESRKDYEWLRARRKEWESSQSSQQKKVRRVRSTGQKQPVKPTNKSGRRVLRIA